MRSGTIPTSWKVVSLRFFALPIPYEVSGTASSLYETKMGVSYFYPWISFPMKCQVQSAALYEAKMGVSYFYPWILTCILVG